MNDHINPSIHYFDPLSYSLLKIEGEGVKRLLQGQLTCNVEELMENKIIWGAHCNAKGRVVSLFRLFKQADHYYLLMPSDLIPTAMAELKKYAIFYKVTLHKIAACSDTYPILKNIVFADAKQQNAFKQWAILHKMPTIYPDTAGLFLPHDLQLDQLGALSFNKGCYTGQEIIARMHYLGKSKNRLYRVKLANYSSIKMGAAIYYLLNNQTRAAGALVDYVEDKEAACHYALALIDQSQAKSQHLFLTLDPLHFLELLD